MGVTGWWSGLEPWRRNQVAVACAIAAAYLGLDLAAPFFPLFIRDLGVRSAEEVALWSGLVYGVAPLLAGLLGPVWGTLADRYGPKLMTLRTLFFFTLCVGLTGFVQEPWQLLALRAATGAFGGFGLLTTALMAAGCPRERLGQAMGLAQMAQFVPLAVAPPIGGMLAEAHGLRINFWLAASLSACSCLLLLVGYREPERSPGLPARRVATATRQGGEVRAVWILAGAAAAMFLAHYVDKSFNPVLPILLEVRGAPADGIAPLVGAVVSLAAIGAAAAGWLFGRLAARWPPRFLLACALAGGALVGVPLATSSSVELFVVLRVGMGVAAGGAMAMAYTAGIRGMPPERSAYAASFIGMGGMLASAASPVSTGLLARLDLGAMLWVNVAVWACGALVALTPRRRTPPAEARPSPSTSRADL